MILHRRLADEGIFMDPVGCVAVEGAGLQRYTFNRSVRLLSQIESLEHSEACENTCINHLLRKMETQICRKYLDEMK